MYHIFFFSPYFCSCLSLCLKCSFHLSWFFGEFLTNIFRTSSNVTSLVQPSLFPQELQMLSPLRASPPSSLYITFYSIFIYNLQRLSREWISVLKVTHEKDFSETGASHVSPIFAPYIQLGSRLFPAWLYFKGVREENQGREGSGVHCQRYFQETSLPCSLCIYSSAVCFPLWFWPVCLSVQNSWYISPVESGRTCLFKIISLE